VPGPDPFASFFALSLFAYGPVPGIELIPYFLALLAWMGVAFGAILLSPITALLRLFRRGKGRRSPPAEPTSEASAPQTAAVPESPNANEGNQPKPQEG
jgi:hypothetical protein